MQQEIFRKEFTDNFSIVIFQDVFKFGLVGSHMYIVGALPFNINKQGYIRKNEISYSYKKKKNFTK